MKVKEFFKNAGLGAGIGVAMIIPGVSGGTIAVLFNPFFKVSLKSLGQDPAISPANSKIVGIGAYSICLLCAGRTRCERVAFTSDFRVLSTRFSICFTVHLRFLALAALRICRQCVACNHARKAQNCA